MDIKGAMKHLEKSIVTLEKEVYNFETVAMSRYEADKKILEKMRADHKRLLGLREKAERREDISIEEVNSLVPSAFR